MGFYSRAFLVFLMKESKKRRQKQPGKLMAKSRSQPVNLPCAWPLMDPLLVYFCNFNFLQKITKDLHLYIGQVENTNLRYTQ